MTRAGTGGTCANVAAVVLAAGGSSRMGSPKPLLSHGGRSLLRRAIDVAHAASCAPIVVVTGDRASDVRAELADLPARAVHNAAWGEGLASSLRAGIEALPEGSSAALVLLCDQPAVSTSLLAEMIETQRRTRSPIVACRYGGVVGVPALFLRDRFAELLALEGDVGARAVLRRAGGAVAIVEFPDGAVDLDTPADWERWKARSDA